MTRGYVQIVEGAWYEPKRKGFVDQCCSCGLTHVTDFAVVDKTETKFPESLFNSSAGLIAGRLPPLGAS